MTTSTHPDTNEGACLYPRTSPRPPTPGDAEGPTEGGVGSPTTSTSTPPRRTPPCLPRWPLGRPLNFRAETRWSSPPIQKVCRVSASGALDPPEACARCRLDASDGFRSAQELHAELQAQGENIALTTVYNQVRALADAGRARRSAERRR